MMQYNTFFLRISLIPCFTSDSRVISSLPIRPPIKNLIKKMQDYLLPGSHDCIGKKLKKELRVGFIRKTLGIVCAQLIFTTAIVGLIINSESAKDYLRENYGIVIVAVLIYIITAIILMCCRQLARTVPANYVLLLIFTVSVSLMVAFICSYYQSSIVFKAFIVTLVVTGAITIYALTSKVKIAYLFGAMIIVLVSLLAVGIMVLFTGMQGSYLYGLYCFLGVVLFGIFLIWDLRRISSSKYGLSHEDYVFASMMIYLDVVNLFLEILRLFGRE